MGRPLRVEYLGALYHVTSRGNERRVSYPGYIARAKEVEWVEYAWVLSVVFRINPVQVF